MRKLRVMLSLLTGPCVLAISALLPATAQTIYYTAPHSDGSPFTINSVYTPIARLSLPAGSFSISAKVTLSNSGSIVETVCQLTGGEINSNDTIVNSDLGPDNIKTGVGSWAQTVPLQVAVTFSAPTTVTLQCEAVPNPLVNAYRPQMTAIPVSSIIMQ